MKTVAALVGSAVLAASAVVAPVVANHKDEVQWENREVYPDCAHRSRLVLVKRWRIVIDDVPGPWSQWSTYRIVDDVRNPHFPACRTSG